ncbi:hypothetical protein [Leucobacter chromiiresistens]|uniref:Uncharacterized protein n=1 Tax=Leucobacter chromiiresistens TaxID=1079994 RepID=A0A1H0ZZ06_9MICO|nr:hypothetical protein [Leucobacter chromiiresistens]SDQ32629.1 hypothetical protein SAMN04488565_2191 [Leucobacter chromiiresistens]
MSKLQSIWKKWKPRLIAAGAVGFAIAVVAVLVAVIVGPGETAKQEETPQADGDSAVVDGGTSPEEREKEAEPAGELAPAPKLGKDGMVEMEVTTDPRVAAASAAQVLMSVDTTKVEWVEDFREETLARVMRPSPDYVGPGDGFQVKEFGGDTLSGDELIDRAPQMLATEEYSPDGYWWLLGGNQSFGGFASYGAKLTSRAIEVYDQEEMDVYSGGAYWTEPSDQITVDIDPEASFELYWVRVETETDAGEGTSTQRYPVALSVYCDPPAKGGVCGVTGLMTGYPDGWKTSY